MKCNVCLHRKICQYKNYDLKSVKVEAPEIFRVKIECMEFKEDEGTKLRTEKRMQRSRIFMKEILNKYGIEQLTDENIKKYLREKGYAERTIETLYYDIKRYSGDLIRTAEQDKMKKELSDIKKREKEVLKNVLG
jgi:hypothetical protein